jgi:hypothetical protein
MAEAVVDPLATVAALEAMRRAAEAERRAEATRIRELAHEVYYIRGLQNPRTRGVPRARAGKKEGEKERESETRVALLV